MVWWAPALRRRCPPRGRLLTAEIRLGRRTVAWTTWILTPGRGTTEVDLAIQLESRRVVTRLVMLLGGRRGIARRLEMALATLATAWARVAENVAAPPAARVEPTPPPPAEQDFPMRPPTDRSIVKELRCRS
jgi:hypothetical protein